MSRRGLGARLVAALAAVVWAAGAIGSGPATADGVPTHLEGPAVGFGNGDSGRA